MRRNFRQIKDRNIIAAHIQLCTTPWTQTYAYFYTSDHTLCGRTNFGLHELTGKICSVYLFSAIYNQMQDVQISACMTAYTDKYGQTLIIVFDEVLCFGTSMDHSLINPNYIHMAVITVSDCPFDEIQKIDIAHEKVFIHFVTDGTTVYLDSRIPTQREIIECTHIFMTGDT